MTPVRRAVVWMALLSVVGCGSTQDGRVPQERESSAAPAPSAPAPGDLDAAIRALVAKRTGSFRQRLAARDDNQSAVVSTVGRYDLTGRTAEAVTTYDWYGRRTGSARDVILRQRVVHGTLYVSSPTWPQGLRNCWVRFSAAEVAAHAVPYDQSGREPSHVAVLRTAVKESGAKSWGSSATRLRVDGSVDAAKAVPLFGPGVVEEVRKLGGVTGRIDAEFHLEHGILLEVAIEGEGLRTAMQESGADGVRDDLRMVDDMTARVTYSNLGQAVRLAAPAPSQECAGETRPPLGAAAPERATARR